MSIIHKISEISELEEVLNSYHFFIVDQNISQLYSDLFYKKKIFIVDAVEDSKTIEVVNSLCLELLDAGITRSDKVIVIGGGLSSDIAGFCCSMLLRGVSWSVVPTTLLAMIDASIGGKTGVNTVHGKNLLGSFHSPSDIYICDKFLSTLDKDQYQSGLGELSKYCLLDQEIYENRFNLEVVTTLCAQYKLKLTTEDPTDRGLRNLLNLGHSFGHAYEKITMLPHGNCVVLGIKVILSLFAPSLLNKYEKLLVDIGYDDIETSRVELNQLFQYLYYDKKRVSGDKIKLILCDEIGHAYMHELSLDQLREKFVKNEFCTNILR